MKKRSLFILLLCVFLLFSGCGESKSEKVIKCTTSNSYADYDLEATYTLYTTGDYINSIKSVETVTSSSQSTLDQMEAYINELYSNMNSTYGGYTFKTTNSGGKVVSDVTINYKKMDVKKLVEADSSASLYVSDGKVTVSGIKYVYSQAGIKCED